MRPVLPKPKPGEPGPRKSPGREASDRYDQYHRAVLKPENNVIGLQRAEKNSEQPRKDVARLPTLPLAPEACPAPGSRLSPTPRPCRTPRLLSPT